MKTLAEQIAIMQHAEKHGMESIEFTPRGVETWQGCVKGAMFAWDFQDYRINPTPTTAPSSTPWTRETCPLGVEVRVILQPDGPRRLILTSDQFGFTTSAMSVRYDEAVEYFEWRPVDLCGPQLKNRPFHPCTQESLPL